MILVYEPTASRAQRGSRVLDNWLEAEIERRGLDAKVDRSVCLGHCVVGPNVRLLGADFFHESTREKLIPLLDSLEENNANGGPKS